jgi:hypothetical protein
VCELALRHVSERTGHSSVSYPVVTYFRYWPIAASKPEDGNVCNGSTPATEAAIQHRKTSSL